MAKVREEIGEAVDTTVEAADEKVNGVEINDEQDTKEIGTEEGVSILAAIEMANRQKKMARRGWSKHTAGSYILVNRGETKPTLFVGKSPTGYQPSIDDVMAKDWFEVI